MKPTSKWLLAADLVYTFLLVVSGTILALWPGTIKPSIPLEGEWLAWLPRVFWAIIALTILLFLAKEHWRNRHTEKLQEAAAAVRDAYEKELKKLLADLKTMPSKDFLDIAKENFQATYASFRETLEHDDSAPDKQGKLEQGIRRILRSIVILASEFEPGFGLYNRYAVNVMLFHSIDDTLSAANRELLGDRLVFCDESTKIGGLGAVLDLKTQMSTTLEGSGEPDDSLVHGFTLPIPLTGHSGAKTRIIPGAPTAAWFGAEQAMNDTRTMHEFCRVHGDFTEQVLNEIKDYFDQGHGKDIRSFICMPLYGSCPIEDSAGVLVDKRLLVGVLNIHSDQTGLLSDENEPFAEYILTLAPFNVLLVELILSWQKVVQNTVE